MIALVVSISFVAAVVSAVKAIQTKFCLFGANKDGII